MRSEGGTGTLIRDPPEMTKNEGREAISGCEGMNQLLIKRFQCSVEENTGLKTNDIWET